MDDQKIREWINEGMNERMNDSTSLENWLLLYPHPFLPIILSLPTLPRGLLSFVEGTVRKVGKQKILFISQGIGLPTPIGGLDSRLQSLPGLLFRACPQWDKSESSLPPSPLGNPAQHLEHSTTPSSQLNLSFQRRSSQGTQALLAHAHHSASLAVTATAASPGPMVPPAPWPWTSSSVIF